MELTPGAKQEDVLCIFKGQQYFREWISPATCSYIARELVENSAEYKNLLEAFDVYIMPSMNPDGYEYSRTTDRMWRKTRSVNPGFECRGTDPNRNWGYNWGLVGASSNPCDGKEIMCRYIKL